MMIPPHKHCNLCEHKVFDVLNGMRCGLTGAKPSFGKKCSKATLDTEMQKQVYALECELARVKSVSTNSIAHFGFFMAIGIGFLVAGYLIFSHALSQGVASAVPIGMMGVGLLTIPYAIGPLRKYLILKKSIYAKIETLHEILELYHIRYTGEVKIKLDLHGNIEHISTLAFDQ